MVKKFVTGLLIAFVVASLGVVAVKGLAGRDQATEISQDQNPGVDGDSTEVFRPDGSDDAGEEYAPEIVVSENLNPNRVCVYYFHRTMRCTGCVNVETAAYNAVAIDHAREVESGLLEWHSINFEKPDYQHFAEEYDLYSQELIFIEIRDGEASRDEKIPEVWQHWSDRDKLRQVINESLDNWLEEIEAG